MKTIEIFAGTKSCSNVMAAHGHSTFTVDNDPALLPDLVADIRNIGAFNIPLKHWNPDIMWCSPPCQGFSVAVIGRNWNHDRTPKTDSARLAVELVEHTINLIRSVKPKWWFIENPRGMLRKLPVAAEIERMGGGPAHCHVLPIWRYETEAHRYMDECVMVAPEAEVRARRPVPRSGTARIEDRHAGNQGSERQRQDPGRFIRRDIKSV